ncbi:MAG TPA: hypothetical protein VM532_08000 [Burkholderiales bacterium]|nr:hypothetical protein [Burkholderiales bacterium]
MRTDEICKRYATKKVGLTVRLLEPDEEGERPSMVLIEGQADALKMLAELLLAVSEEPENEGFSISPFGAGGGHFSSLAELGVYIHRIDKT